MSDLKWTKAEIAEFDKLVDGVSSLNQVKRIEARLDMSDFVTKHGKEKCEAMFAHPEAGGDIADGPATAQANSAP